MPIISHVRGQLKSSQLSLNQVVKGLEDEDYEISGSMEVVRKSLENRSKRATERLKCQGLGPRVVSWTQKRNEKDRVEHWETHCIGYVCSRKYSHLDWWNPDFGWLISQKVAQPQNLLAEPYFHELHLELHTKKWVFRTSYHGIRNYKWYMPPLL